MPRMSRGVVRVRRDYDAKAEPPLEDDAPLVRIMRPQGGVASREQVLELLTPQTIKCWLRSDRLFALHRCVYALSPIVTDHGRRVAALLASGERATLSGTSAGDLWGYVVHPGGAHHVTVPVGGGRTVDGVIRHRTRGFKEGDIVIVGGMSVTTPARTFLDIAPGLSVPDLRRAIGQAQYDKLIDPDALAAAIAAHPGHRGARKLRLADPGLQYRAETDSPLEDELLALMLAAGLPEPECQVTVYGLSGRKRRADFLFREAGVIVEADGRGAHARAMAFEDDRDRDTDLVAMNLLTLRFTRVQARTSPKAVTDRIAAVLRSRGGAGLA
jgi:hypothetical protein